MCSDGLFVNKAVSQCHDGFLMAISFMNTIIVLNIKPMLKLSPALMPNFTFPALTSRRGGFRRLWCVYLSDPPAIFLYPSSLLLHSPAPFLALLPPFATRRTLRSAGTLLVNLFLINKKVSRDFLCNVVGRANRTFVYPRVGFLKEEWR